MKAFSLGIATSSRGADHLRSRPTLEIFFKLPLVRGIITLLSALILGIQALNYSADQALHRAEAAKHSEPHGLEAAACHEHPVARERGQLRAGIGRADEYGRYEIHKGVRDAGAIRTTAAETGSKRNDMPSTIGIVLFG
jgi:hypothetical protein